MDSLVMKNEIKWDNTFLVFLQLILEKSANILAQRMHRMHKLGSLGI